MLIFADSDCTERHFLRIKILDVTEITIKYELEYFTLL